MTERTERTERCETCKWWKRDLIAGLVTRHASGHVVSSQNIGYCRRFPRQWHGKSVATLTPSDALQNWSYPVQNKDDFCGEWMLAPGLGIGGIPLSDDFDNAVFDNAVEDEKP